MNNRTRSALAVGWCEEHQKLLYPSRKVAKAAGRKIHGACLSEFRCEVKEGANMWHVGNLPGSVRSGRIDRSWITRRIYPTTT